MADTTRSIGVVEAAHRLGAGPVIDGGDDDRRTFGSQDIAAPGSVVKRARQPTRTMTRLITTAKTGALMKTSE